MPFRRDRTTADLFGAGERVRPFPQHKVRAHSLSAQISRAVSETLKSAKTLGGSPLSRDEIAARMSVYLDGEEVSKNVLDAYASQGREGHNMSVVRLCALMHATNDFRPLQLIAEKFDLTTIPRKFETAVEESVLAEQRDEIERRLDALRKRRADQV